MTDAAKPLLPMTDVQVEAAIREAWARWGERLRGGRLAPRKDERPHFDDVVLATRGDLPSRLMRPDLREVWLIDWGELALSAFNPTPQGPPTPLWAGFAALRLAGFGGDMLLRLVKGAPVNDTLSGEDIATFVEAAPPSGAGSLLIVGDDGGLAATPPLALQPPTLAVRESQLAVYGRAIDWLVEREALSAVVDGRI